MSAGRAPAALLALALAACATPGGGGCVALGIGARQCLAPPSALAPLGATVRSVAYRQGARSELWVLQIEARDDATLLVASDPLGLPRFVLRHDAAGLAVDPPGALARADAAQLLALIQFAHAEPEALRHGLHGAELLLGTEGSVRWRELRVGGALRARAASDATGLTLRVPALDLELRIEELVEVTP